MIVFCRLAILIVFLGIPSITHAQIYGSVIDATTEQPVPLATLSYHNGKWMTKADEDGQFSIERHIGWRLFVSSVGYKAHEILVDKNTPNQLRIELEPESQMLEEVTVKSSRSTKYRRKNNPAVELMRKVIAAKKKNDLHQHAYYRYTNYQQIIAAVNDLKQEDLQKGLFKNRPWLNEYLEIHPNTGKLILPFSLEETVTEKIYRKTPAFKKEIVQAHQISGLTGLFQTGDIFNVILKEYFTDIDIYDDQIRLLQNPFTSPIGRDAILFYHYYITDTVVVENNRCYQLDFIPANPKDFGFRGQLFVLTDSSYQVKRCDLTLPKVSEVNWVEGLKCIQEFTQLENGEWVLDHDDLVVEMKVTNQTARGVVTRTTRRSDFSFDELPDGILYGNGTKEYAENNEVRDSCYWNKYRTSEQVTSKATMERLTENVEKLKFFPYFRFLARAVLENFIETGGKSNLSKIDIGPVTSSLSSNFHDGLRLRAGGQTNANFHSHVFLKGYYAYGTKSQESYYDAQLVYAFNRPKYLPHEFPRKTVSIELKRDAQLPSDKFLQTDKDNIFSSAKISDVDKMFQYSSQVLRFDYEKLAGIKYLGELKTERVYPVGNISFSPLSLSDNISLPSIRYAEVTVGIRYAPREVFLNTKQQRWTLNYDMPVLRLQHTAGIRGLLGGQYNYNYTEFEFKKRFWLPLNLGCLDSRLQCGVQWNQVPFPLLIMPAANMSYFLDNETFNLINNMEFLNDRYVSLFLDWDLNGKIFNMIPLLKKAECREHLGVKYLWGTLTEKNNPFVDVNRHSDVVMTFPDGCNIMDGKRPYWEISFGVHNIFRVLQIEYIKRMNYINLSTTNKHIVKFSLDFKF